MTPLPPAVRWRMLARSFAVQGSWNYETLIGTGFAFALLPALEHQCGNDEQKLQAALTRHAMLFNSHPYLATVAAGAVVRLEADGVHPVLIGRFKDALRGPLGSLGDQLFWGAWRPMAALLGVTVLLLGLPWWVGVALFLVIYNALHLPVRVWGLLVGDEAGLDVGKRLRGAPLHRIAQRAADVGAVLAGATAVLALAPSPARPLEALLGLVVVAAGAWLGLRARKFLGALVVLAAALAILNGLVR